MKYKKNKIKKESFLAKHPIEVIELIIIIIILVLNIFVISIFTTHSNPLEVTPTATYINLNSYKNLFNQISKKFIYNLNSPIPQISAKNVF